MEKLFFFIALLLLFSNELIGQVSINTDGSQPDPSAMLEVKSDTKGFLPPRVALTTIISAVPLSAPATGLLVYNTATAGTTPNNVVPGNYYWNGSRWVPVSPPQGVNAGDMLYWNGTQWVGIPAGSNGKVLNVSGGIPAWGGAQLPVISTTDVTDITQTTATGGGIVTSDGGLPVTASGICWSTTANPTIAGNHTSEGIGSGSFISYFTGLTSNTLYNARAYATNTLGTSYGNQVTFTSSSFTIGQS
jgi:hypothetical protein